MWWSLSYLAALKALYCSGASSEKALSSASRPASAGVPPPLPSASPAGVLPGAAFTLQKRWEMLLWV